VLAKLGSWVAGLDKNDPEFEHHRLEALWVTWGANRIDEDLLKEVLKSPDFRARSAAVRVLRYGGHQIDDQAALLMEAAKDDENRVRLEAFVAASWLGKEVGLPIVQEAGKKALDKWMAKPHEAAVAHLNGYQVGGSLEDDVITHLQGDDRKAFIKGKEIYEREGYCQTCHQPNGRGLQASGFPPISRTEWANGDEERLIKLTLKGMLGPIEIQGKKYPGQVPMTPFEGLLNDEELAAVLTYVRNSFGNKASVINPERVKVVRAAIADKTGFYSPEELLKAHPMNK